MGSGLGGVWVHACRQVGGADWAQLNEQKWHKRLEAAEVQPQPQPQAVPPVPCSVVLLHCLSRAWALGDPSRPRPSYAGHSDTSKWGWNCAYEDLLLGPVKETVSTLLNGGLADANEPGLLHFVSSGGPWALGLLRHARKWLLGVLAGSYAEFLGRPEVPLAALTF